MIVEFAWVLSINLWLAELICLTEQQGDLSEKAILFRRVFEDVSIYKFVGLVLMCLVPFKPSNPYDWGMGIFLVGI